MSRYLDVDAGVLAYSHLSLHTHSHTHTGNDDCDVRVLIVFENLLGHHFLGFTI